LVYAGNENGWSESVNVAGETLPESSGGCDCKDELEQIHQDLIKVIAELERIEG